MVDKLPSGIKPMFIVMVSSGNYQLIHNTGSAPGTLQITAGLARKLEAAGTKVIDVRDALRRQENN